MPTIGAAVTESTKQNFELLARQRGTTASRLSASLIADFIELQTRASPTPTKALPQLLEAATASPAGAKTEQVYVRLTPYYFAELGRLAEERNWYRSTYLANLFKAHADLCPVLCEAEINAVRQVGRQLADMGRNINQITRKLNVSLEHAHLTMSIDFELVKMLIELEASSIKSLLRANLQGWGVLDA